MEMRKFGSIEQFRNIVKKVKDHCEYHNTKLPTLEFTGTVKLHGCVHSDSMITLADGSREMIKDITSGTSILSYNETTKEIEFDTVNEVIIQDLDKLWVNLEFDNGTNLKCTEDHPILTTVGWVEAKDLTVEHELILEI